MKRAIYVMTACLLMSCGGRPLTHSEGLFSVTVIETQSDCSLPPPLKGGIDKVIASLEGNIVASVFFDITPPGAMAARFTYRPHQGWFNLFEFEFGSSCADKKKKLTVQIVHFSDNGFDVSYREEWTGNAQCPDYPIALQPKPCTVEQLLRYERLDDQDDD